MNVELIQIQEWLSGLTVLAGSLIILVACIGIARLPDLFTRAHAVGKGMTLGISLMLLGLWLDPHTNVSGLKILAAVFLQFVTIPVASHLLARLAWRRERTKAD